MLYVSVPPFPTLVILPFCTSNTQSTNDVIPSAGKLTVLDLLPDLLHALESLHAALLDKSQEFDHILKMGRTQLEDAVPMRLGQSFHAYATMIERDIRRIECARKELFTLNLGGTAIGTTINASDYYLHNTSTNQYTVGFSFAITVFQLDDTIAHIMFFQDIPNLCLIAAAEKIL